MKITFKAANLNGLKVGDFLERVDSVIEVVKIDGRLIFTISKEGFVSIYTKEELEKNGWNFKQVEDDSDKIPVNKEDFVELATFIDTPFKITRILMAEDGMMKDHHRIFGLGNDNQIYVWLDMAEEPKWALYISN